MEGEKTFEKQKGEKSGFLFETEQINKKYIQELARGIEKYMTRENEQNGKIEVEIRFGMLIYKSTKARINNFVNTMCFANRDPMYVWNNGISIDHKIDVMSYLKEANYPSVHKTMIDKIHRTHRTTYVDDKVVERIRKDLKCEFFIIVPHMPYDLKISVCQEIAIPENSPLVKREMLYPFERKKMRTCYHVGDEFVVDLTDIVQKNVIMQELEIECLRLNSPYETMFRFLDLAITLNLKCQKSSYDE